jgi:hypothetical protein
MKITLRNQFHNTRTVVIAESNQILSDSQVRRAEKALCGMKDCGCGGILDNPREDRFAVRREDTRSGRWIYVIYDRFVRQ